MLNEADIRTISKTAPLSYAQAMGPFVPMRDSPYVPVPGQTTMSDNQVDCSMVQNQQSHPTVAPCIIPNETLEPRGEQTFSKRCATRKKKIFAACVFVIPFLFLLRFVRGLIFATKSRTQ